MDREILIQAEHLQRDYGPIRAVHDVSFELAKGDVLGFLGPNGAGKSTTMQMLTGTLAPSAGTIRVRGVDLLDHPRRAKRELGYLPEQPPLYRELTVDEYLRYCARLRGVPGREVTAAVDRARARCGLNEVRRRLIANLSKGYQQRVGIAQAILHNPAAVILDEPTVGLDPIQIREIRGLIRELGEAHGIILSTHILPEVQGTCNRVQIIHRGRLVFADSMQGLESHLQAQACIVAFRQPPAIETLQQLAGVEEVAELGQGRFRLRYTGDNPAEALTERAVNAGWGLQELIPERRTLEQIFVELTSRDAAEEAA
ncbi:multidrug ABC transporter ATP-binding protein [Thiohalobacter sp. COW1]|uniref:ABC-type multidrug transporter, ATPase component n=1 Tax=Thiohalobacter thiocyanaticus TaxID=585455 RepID=A0A1Z4VUT3_9GAMM|nr:MULTISPECIES: ATP-binding cassette domain-containing protein [Thiohalobacter]BAZ95399.1 ABC-type multidrug transporter, ATPase component [Thiohalobacter thiocyanaticus]BCO32652.1 multidrug ABC transporter ATP-binding protein [Thiohalobacter sp. COW1]